MVAGILEKSKRLRKAFFIFRNSQSQAQPMATLKPRNVGRVAFSENRAAGLYVCKTVCDAGTTCVSKSGTLKRQRGARRDSRSRRRQPRRFAIFDLNSFAPVRRPVSAPPARGAACPKLPRESCSRSSEALGGDVI